MALSCDARLSAIFYAPHRANIELIAAGVAGISRRDDGLEATVAF